MKVGMLFPGYGSQFIGMGKELYDEYRIIQEYFEQSSHCLNTNFVKLCFASSDCEMKKIENSYPAIFLVSTSIASYLRKELNIVPDIIAGHGIGEYSALCSFGAFSFADGLYLLNKLSLFYKQSKESLDLDTILIRDIDKEKLEDICKNLSFDKECAYISVYKSEYDYIVSGCKWLIEDIKDFIKRKRIAKVKKTDINGGFHTSELIDLEKQLRLYLTKVDFKDIEVPLVSGASLNFVTKSKDIENCLMDQITKPLYWHDVIKKFSICDVIIVLSPCRYLYQEVKDYYPNKIIVPVDQLKDIDKLKSILT